MDNDHKKKEVTYDERLKGTLVGVFLVGASILLTWIIVFYYYIVTV
ncbi:MAG TPA: cytochrome c oxidase subunit 2A [Bacillales bacterium]|nr:cytochrome c oxidase subunit 2A [Bacillales bacterium]